MFLAICWGKNQAGMMYLPNELRLLGETTTQRISKRMASDCGGRTRKQMVHRREAKRLDHEGGWKLFRGRLESRWKLLKRKAGDVESPILKSGG